MGNLRSLRKSLKRAKKGELKHLARKNIGNAVLCFLLKHGCRNDSSLILAGSLATQAHRDLETAGKVRMNTVKHRVSV